jgi:serine/threonine protein phosphatase PrpC/predicted Ser/Thr protein kinase
MASQLAVSIGYYSSAGRKPVNQDCHGVQVPQEPLLSTKGVAAAVADGISSSSVSQEASSIAVKNFLEDYFCTSEAWSTKHSVQKVLLAINSWLYSHTQQSQYRYERDRGYVCTLSALIIKSTTAHLFHIGDTRIYRLQNNFLEQLTADHRVWVARDKNYLSRALGMDSHLEIDYKALPVAEGDIYMLATDGVYEYSDEQFLSMTLASAASVDLHNTAKAIAAEAYRQGSEDNLSVVLVRIEKLPDPNIGELYQQLTELPFPPPLEARMSFDGYRIVRNLHSSHRSHVYLASDEETEATVVIKTPSIALREDTLYLERFLTEEWIARRIDSPHVLKAYSKTRPAHYLYTVTEYINGRTLRQWMIDHPKPDLETVRGIVEQMAKGLRAFHKLEILHQDLRPENIMIDMTGTVKIIDFGSARVAGLMEIASPLERINLLGTAQYTAPEYLLGEAGTIKSDQFSLAVIMYEMLSGRLPYGSNIAKTRTRAAQMKLHYRSVLDDHREIPVWLDSVLAKALEPNPYKRYEDVSEFIFHLRHPTQEFLKRYQQSFIERNPLLFWKVVALIQLVIIVLLLAR